MALPQVIVALPFAYREGVDEYNGIMRHLRESGESWDLRIVRSSFGAEMLRGVSLAEVSGAICGMEYSSGISSYSSRFPEDAVDMLTAAGVPVVGLDVPAAALREKKGGRLLAFVEVDSEKIGRVAAETLAKAGEYASFGFVGAFTEKAWSRDRGAYFARELRRLGRRGVKIFRGDATSAPDALLAWLKSLPKPAAVFCSNDYCAAGVMRTAGEGGVVVPDDLAVLGVDDDPIFCVHTKPSLSSIRPDFEKEGHLAAKTLSLMMKGVRQALHNVASGNVSATLRTSTAPCSTAGRLVRRADEIIAERACKGLGSDALAQALGISRRLLDLRYRQINGKSVHEGIEDVRLDHAVKLLSGTRLTYAQIAAACGYGSDTYLETVFRRRFGKSLGSVRRGQHIA